MKEVTERSIEIMSIHVRTGEVVLDTGETEALIAGYMILPAMIRNTGKKFIICLGY
ncbi:MAG: hypothetical protein LBH32_13715 [Dysgonamonadaceae bacterium]|jgi:hypothetical protein|nr:hypothetical protein [Dysgonamonadaceae bacterium]